jgi:uncharacterized membrane protein YqjE
MADHTPNLREPTVSALVTGIVADAQTLMREELQLARVEIKQELKKTRDAAISFGAGAALALASVAFLTLAVVFLITWATNGFIPLWGSFAIVGGACLISAVALFLVGKSRAEEVHLVPPQTAETLQENVQWIQKRR